MNKNDYNTNIDYPIDLVFDENEYIPVGDIPTEVLINVDGSGWSIISASLGIGIDEYQIFVDSYRGKYYTNGKDLTYYISNHINNNLKVNYIINDTIHFNIEPIVTKTVKIQLDPLFVSNKFKLKHPPKLSNNRIEISGPKNLIDSINDTFYIQDNELTIGNSLDDKIIDVTTFFDGLITPTPSSINVTAIVDEYVSKTFTTQITDSLNTENKSFVIKGRYEVLKEKINRPLKSIINFSIAEVDQDSLFIKCYFDENIVRNVKYSPKKVALLD